MRYAIFASPLPIVIALLLPGGCNRWSSMPSHAGGHSHDDSHDHGSADDQGHHHDEPEPVSVTLFTDEIELFLEYPHLVAGEPTDFLAHWSVLRTGEPIRSGSLTFALTTPEGKTERLTLEAPRRDGLFVPQWTFAQAGNYRLRLVLDSPQARQTVDVGEVVVHASAHDATHAAEDAAGEEHDGVIPFLLEQQWKIGLLLERVSARTLIGRVASPARIVAPQGAAAAVSPPVAGRLLLPENGRLPRVGDSVEAGQVLARIEPPLPVTEAAQLYANRAWIQSLETELALRELDLGTKMLEIERSLLQAKARLEFAQRAHERTRRLRDRGVGTEQQLDEVEQNLRLAKAEHDSALAMGKSYKQAAEKLARLRSWSAQGQEGTGTESTALHLPLRAPISGHVVSVSHIEGESLDAAGQEVFRIVNTEHVWVEANISEFDLAELAEKPGAIMTLLAYPGQRFDILGQGGGRLVNIGRVVDPDTRTVSIIYELPNPDGLFRIGMFADIHLETRSVSEAVALPEEAIVMDNGRPVAFVLLSGESFQRRELETGVRDGGYVEVKSGVEAGERVATRGAYAVKLASLAPDSLGHGHVH